MEWGVKRLPGLCRGLGQKEVRVWVVWGVWAYGGNTSGCICTRSPGIQASKPSLSVKVFAESAVPLQIVMSHLSPCRITF